MLERLFEIRARQSTVMREVVGGATTFVTLSYIIFVQPAVLGLCGMNASAVMFATCVCSALACLVMGLWANLPIALAPVMGHNFFFALTVCGPVAVGGFGLTWPEALAANFVAGVLFLLLSLLGLRGALIRALPDGLKYALASGIGLLIALVGLQWSGIVVSDAATYVTLGSLRHPVPLLSLFGLAVIGVLSAWRFRGAILVGMVVAAAAGYLAGHWWGQDWSFELVGSVSGLSMPAVSATAGKVFGGLASLVQRPLALVAVVVFTFLLLDVFDTIGTLVGVCERAGLMEDGQLPRGRRALLADATGTLAGTMLGTSTITSYIESAAGVAAGARTGLAAVVTGLLLLASVLAYPLLSVFGTSVAVPAAALGSTVVQETAAFNTVRCYPVVAPVLIVIGCHMLPLVGRIAWDDFSEALPAFLTIVVMQLSMSITDGIAWGFVSYALLKLLSGRGRQCPATVYVCAALFVGYYVLFRGRVWG